MQLPAEFPHTRHEQYLVALPDELRSRAETWEAIAVLHRGQLFFGAIREKAVAELARRGWSDEDIRRASLRQGLPAAFHPMNDNFWPEEP
jgi:hypothetical protein